MKKGSGVHVCNRNVELKANKYKVGFKDYDPKRHIEFNTNYQLFPTSVEKYGWTREAGCQCNIRTNTTGYGPPTRKEIVYYSGLPTKPKLVYAYSRVTSFTDIGVGSVMVQQKKRVRKIYLPETENRGVGSTDLTPLIRVDKRHRYIREDYPRYARDEYTTYGRNDFYFPKKTSSKCVGGAVDNIKKCTEKLSPIIFDNRSKGTSSNELPEVKVISKDTGNNTIDKNLTNITTQVESNNDRNAQASSRQMKTGSKNFKEIEPIQTIRSVRSPIKKSKLVDNVTSVRSPIKKIQESTIQKSSDSLEQHVHNLEDPSFIPSTGSSDPMENKLEKEYRRMFSAKSKDDKDKTEKPIQDLKSTSLLRRRFEALRRGIAKKEENKKKETTDSNITDFKDSNPVVESTGIVQSSKSPTRVDISIESDPPSLEAKSFSQTKLFSPAPSAYSRSRSRNVPRKKSHVAKKEKESHNWPPADKKVDDSDVQGMFKIWGEKFNFDGSKQTSPGVSFEKGPKEIGIKMRDDELKTDSQEKKEGKRFFFFKKKSKDKTKTPCKSKKGVTTGRCEVKNCPVLNGPPQPKPDIKFSSKEKPKVDVKKSDENDEIIKRNWLQKFIQRTIESRKSLQIRWSNKTYATSSSTVFELMDNVYRQTEVIIRSQSETSTATSSYYQSYNRHHVNFVQDIEAWMVPKLEQDLPFFLRNNHRGTIKDRKWFIDKSKAFAHKIELVLHSKNFVKCHRARSSEYLRIDIPKGFFSDVSSESEKFATSNSEEVYKIIEYESPESRSAIKMRNKRNIGDYNTEKITNKLTVKDTYEKITKKISVKDTYDKITKKVSVKDEYTDTRVIETVIKKPPIHRDVVIQGSNVHIPKRCDVIGVGIITHRDIRELTRPILKIDDDVTDEESEHAIENTIKQCEFAESYLRDYYRNWMPLGIDLFSSCASDNYVKFEIEESLSSINNQGDGTKSCPNLKDYNSTTNLEPASSNSCPYNLTDKSKIITTFKSLTQSEPPLDTKRVLPKDSFEVLKKRMLYACGNKGKWNYADELPYSVPSIQDKAEQDAINELSGQCKPRKRCIKRVSITNCDNPSGDDPMPCHRSSTSPTNCKDCKPLPGILSFTKKSGSNTKHATINKDDVCEIMPAPCKEKCETRKNPPCSKPMPKPKCVPPKPKPASKKSSKKSNSSSSCTSKRTTTKCSNSSSSSSKSYPPRKICSCMCTPKMSSPLTSGTSSTMHATCSPQNMNIAANFIPQIPNQHQSSSLALNVSKPCTCITPEPPNNKSCPCPPKDKKGIPSSNPAQPSPFSTESSKPSPTSSSPSTPQMLSLPPGLPLKASTASNTSKLFPPKSSTSCKECDNQKPTQNTNIASNFIPQESNQNQTSPLTSNVAKPCTCIKPDLRSTLAPPKNKPCPCSPKDKKNIPSSNSAQPCPFPTESSKPSPTLSPPCTPIPLPEMLSLPPGLSLKPSPASNTSKLSPPKSSTSFKESDKQTPSQSCASSIKDRTPPACPRCFKKDHSQSSNTKQQHEISNEPSQESIFAPILSKSTQNDPNAPCPGSPCAARLSDLAKKAKSLPKMQGVHLKMKPAPNPPKCGSDCPGSPRKERRDCPSPPPINCEKKENYNKKGNNASSGCTSPSDEAMMIRVKKETPSTEEIREGLNVKVKDADGNTLYERRDYKADCQRETHAQQILGEMYKVNRVATQSSEKATYKEDTHESSKSEASIANLIEISFGLKVTQGDKIAEINLGDEQEEDIDKTRKGCKPCNAEKSHDVFMTSGETESVVDDSSDKNDINIKIVIKNFKTKAEKSIKNRKNEDFSRKISEKFQTVSTGYSEIIPDNIDNMYSMHKTTVDLTTSKVQISQDINGDQEINGDIEKNEMKTSIEPIPKEIKTIGEQLENIKVVEEIKKDASLDSTMKTGMNEVMQMQSETVENLSKTKIDDHFCKCITGEIRKFDLKDFKNTETFPKIQKTDTYAVLQTKEIKENMIEKNHNTEPDQGVHIPNKEIHAANAELLKPDEEILKAVIKIQKLDKEIQKPDEDIQKPDEDIQKTDEGIQKSGEAIQKLDVEIQKLKQSVQETDKDISMIKKIETCEITRISQVIDTISDIEKRIHTLIPVINIIRDIESSNIEKTNDETTNLDKIRSIENNKEMKSDNSQLDKIETIEMKPKSELAAANVFEIQIAENEAVISQDIGKTEKISTDNIITKSDATLETIARFENDAVLPESDTQTEDTITSDTKQSSELAKENSEISHRTYSNENIEVIPSNRHETEGISINKMMLKSDSIKGKSESAERNNAIKNPMPEKKSGIEKFNTTITIELKLDARERIQSIENYEEIPETNNNTNNDTEINNNTVTENNTNIATIVTCETVQKYETCETVQKYETCETVQKYETCETVQKYENIEIKSDTNITIQNNNDLLLSETMQVIENWKNVFDEKDITFKNHEANYMSGVSDRVTEKQAFNDEIANEIKNFENFLKVQKQLQYPAGFHIHKPVEITPDFDVCEEPQIIIVGDISENTYKESDFTEDERNLHQENEQTALPVCNQHIDHSETPTDTDGQENNTDLANTSDDVYDYTTGMSKPHTKREKKEMLKQVFEKATTQKWKGKGRMKRLRNMLRLILTSDSSDIEEAAINSKELMKDITYSTYEPNYLKATGSMTNYYRVDNIIPSDEENKMAENYPTQEQSESSDSSEYQTNVSKCLCNTMAEGIKKRSDTLISGCCCRSPPKLHEQTSCNITNDQLCMLKTAEYIDVQTQNSLINSRVTNVMVAKKMENVMTSKPSNAVETVKINSTVSPYKDDKECEARNIKTNTMLGLIDDGKIVIRTSDENKMSLQTEIVIGWKGKDKKKPKKHESVYLACPADVLQSYETKKAVLEIYTEKTGSDKGEKLVAKLPKFLYEKEEEIETNYVKNVLLAHDKV